jgi:hypothetical protein
VPFGIAAANMITLKNPMPEDKTTWTISIQTTSSLRETSKITICMVLGLIQLIVVTRIQTSGRLQF